MLQQKRNTYIYSTYVLYHLKISSSTTCYVVFAQFCKSDSVKCGVSWVLIYTGRQLFFFFLFWKLVPGIKKLKDVGSLKRDRWENNNNSKSCFWCLNYPEKVKWSSVVLTLGIMMNDDSVCVCECALQRNTEKCVCVLIYSACVGEVASCQIFFFSGFISGGHGHCKVYWLRSVTRSSTLVINIFFVCLLFLCCSW